MQHILSTLLAVSVAAQENQPAEMHKGYGLVIGFILFFVVASIVITWWTTKSTRSTKDFYVAGKGVPWIQVGIAMVGSYLSAASFLGCAGDIGVFGIDSIWLSIGFFGGYMAVLMLIAGPLRNVGSFTVADALHRRFPDDRIKLAVMVCTVVISTFYLVPQMLGAGLLFQLLLGWDFVAVTVGLGILMSVYIIFGGMKSTLYNQVLQALFLWVAMVVITVLAFVFFGHSDVGYTLDTAARVAPPEAVIDALKAANPGPTGFVTPLKELAASVATMPSDQAITVVRDQLPQAANALSIGVKTASTLAQISTIIALVFGTAGLPHILIMFYTVPSAKAAKKSVTLCIVALGIFYLCAIVLGFLLFPAIYPKLLSWVADPKGGIGLAKNMAVVEISERVGGSWLMAISAAGAVAAILSTAAGLMITAASTISHDLYKVYINRNATEKQELMIAKITTLAMSAVAVILAVLLKDENVAWLVTLAFGIAASAIFPAMMATLWWKRATRQGVIGAIVSGLSVSVLFIVLLLTGVKSFLGMPTSGGPGVFGVTIGIAVLVVVSLLTRDRGKDVDAFFAQAHHAEKED